MSFPAVLCPFCRSAAVQATRRQRWSTSLQAVCPICAATGPLTRRQRGESPAQLQERALAPWRQLAAVAAIPANDAISLTRMGAGRAG